MLEKNRNYKLRYRPNYAVQLSKYKYPLPMTGNPPEATQTGDWDKRCRIIYEHMIAMKNGVIPPKARRGLWHHASP